VTRHQGLTHPRPSPKNVLTEKKGLFLGVLAGKQGFGAGQKPSFFAFLHVFVVFFFCKYLKFRIFRKIDLSKKNRAKKPTIGFLFLQASGNIVA
jgi:hypothetical protein